MQNEEVRKVQAPKFQGPCSLPRGEKAVMLCVMPVNYQKFIERRQQVCGGEPVITGTRVTVRSILASLAEGASVEQIVADFPTVTREAVLAMIAFAAASAEEDIPVSSVPSPA
jgi:uncharacterized protein (DUF433 family)